MGLLADMLRLFIVCASAFIVASGSSSYSERVRLEDVQALTLYADRMTTGRRSAPVPQLKCVKGLNFPQPRLVQCVNRGWDGSSVQWECKAQLDSRFELGQIEVVCEGFDYADDPYILKGSCGLEYAIESKPGYSEGNSGKSYGWKQDLYNKQGKEDGGGFGNVLFFAGCCIVLYGIYKTCLAPSMEDPTSQYSTTDDDRPDDGLGPSAPRSNMGWNVPGTGGLGTGYTPQFDGCGAGRRRRSGWRNMGYGGAGAQGGGFWTGLATGGMLGYMFGNNRSGNNAAPPRHANSGGSSGLFTSGGSSSSFSAGPTSESTSFGGTRRR